MTDKELELVTSNIRMLNERLAVAERRIKALAMFSSMQDVGTLLALIQKRTLTPQEIAQSARRLLDAVEQDPELAPALPLAQGRNALFERLAGSPADQIEAVQGEAEAASLQFLRTWASETKH